MTPSLPYGSKNPFLVDFEEEETLRLIAEGNLKRKKAEPVFVAVWNHIGYVAHIQRCTCACGYSYDHFLAIFSREKSATGETRDTALSRGFQIPLGNSYPVEISHHKIPACPACLASKGFADFSPA